MRSAAVDGWGWGSTFASTEKGIFQMRAEERGPAMQKPKEKMFASEETAGEEAVGLHKDFWAASRHLHKTK